jgi:hypothetical protein
MCYILFVKLSIKPKFNIVVDDEIKLLVSEAVLSCQLDIYLVDNGFALGNVELRIADLVAIICIDGFYCGVKRALNSIRLQFPVSVRRGASFAVV